MTDDTNKEEQAARRESRLTRYSAETQQQLRSRINDSLFILRFAVYVNNIERGCTVDLSHLVTECMHPLDNHVMPGFRYTREARKIARKFATLHRRLYGKRSGALLDLAALETAALSASRALSEAASRYGEEYYEALHTINREVYESNRSV